MQVFSLAIHRTPYARYFAGLHSGGLATELNFVQVFQYQLMLQVDLYALHFICFSEATLQVDSLAEYIKGLLSSNSLQVWTH